ncbi:MAG: PEP-utilizing enzyme [Candidatus Woesearchaeota archaeon]|nr:PEP-utilizing enzyme [Candidatus Woesearchaeota archaeon]
MAKKEMKEKTQPIIALTKKKGEKENLITSSAKEGIWFKLSDIPNTNYVSLFAYNLINPIRDYPLVNAGEYIKEGFVEWNNGTASYHLKRAQFNKAADILSGFIINMTKEHKNRVAEYRKLARELMNKSERFMALDFAKMSDLEIVSEFKKLAELQRKNHLIGGILTFLPDEEQQRVSNAVLNKIRDLIETSKKELDLTECWIILTTPREESFREKEEKELLEICIEILKDRKFSGKTFSKGKLILSIKKQKPISYNKLIKHYKKYCWMPYMYIGPKEDITHFFERVDELIEIGLAKAKELLNQIEKKHKEIESKQNEILSSFKPNKKDKELLRFASELVWLKGYRKDTFYHLFYCYEPFLREAAKRTGTTFELIGFLFPWEFEEALLLHKHANSELELRKKHSLYYLDKDKIIFYYGKEIDNFKKEISIEGIKTEPDNLIGMVAYPGYAKGIVSIIETVEDMKKMNFGNILVSQMTGPNIVPAMKKAAAIITDTGGLTCHASILSREFKIPCIVGTKYATKILKEGDLVEVDANNGIVKILKKAEKENE